MNNNGNRSELKTFAIQTRRELIYDVSLRAELFGIEKNSRLQIEKKNGQFIMNGLVYPKNMESAFFSLQEKFDHNGFDQLIEEVAYTWFNRMVAIRYMEVNHYIPDRNQTMSGLSESKLTSFVSSLAAMNVEIDEESILLNYRKGEDQLVNRELFLAQCQLLHTILPASFARIEDYTQLLMPDLLLNPQSTVYQFLRKKSLTESFSEVEVIGWMYQFYNSEPKDQVFANLKKNQKMDKNEIPAATQLFTPKWIVKYMTENSLGKLWIEGNPSTSLKQTMHYFIDSSETNEKHSVQREGVNVEEITFLDPCVGSGHILVYAFDLFYDMYMEAGYEQERIPQLILEKNLYGIDIDDRAAQLATFALLMKASQKSRFLLQEPLKINVISIQESNEVDIEGIVRLLAHDEYEASELNQFLSSFVDAKQFGSILQPDPINLQKYIDRIHKSQHLEITLENYQVFQQLEEVLQLLQQGELLANTYDVTVTNPPYIGIRGLNQATSDYIKTSFPYSKYDLSAVFMERAFHFTKEDGFFSLINQQSWMFLSSYEKLRLQLFRESTILSMLHLGAHAFEDISGEIVQSTAFVCSRLHKKDYMSIYYRLVDYKQSKLKKEAFLAGENKYSCKKERFSIIPESPVVYWLTETMSNVFIKGTPLKEIAEPRQGLATADNERFHRYWYEVRFSDIGFSHSRASAEASEKKWFPLNKGGPLRKWYGNNYKVVNWQHDGKEIRDDKLHKLSIGKCLKSNSKPKNVPYYFREGITWSLISSSKFGVRCYPEGMIFDVGSHAFFCEQEDYYFFASFLNSKVASTLLQTLNPTINYSSGVIAKLPVIRASQNDQINKLARMNVDLAKHDWDSEETSWNFLRHPFRTFLGEKHLSAIYEKWKEKKEFVHQTVKTNEEELNRIFINLYGLQEELTADVQEKDITITIPDRMRETKLFLSYFIGCLLGRYSLDMDGIVFAGDDWDASNYVTFSPTRLGVVQLESDDLLFRLREFLKICFDETTVEDNLLWLAQSLKMKREESVTERLKRYFSDEFYKDHVKLYQKRPIYWLIESGIEKGFRGLVYMHRMQMNTMDHIKSTVVAGMHQYVSELLQLDTMCDNSSSKRQIEAYLRRKKQLEARVKEVKTFQEVLEKTNVHNLDLDEGIGKNYDNFSHILANI
ncbi:BREX-1 system adenine-specific DNA-methyltransferase PglX [Alkalihalobacillus sp. MEB130]|uniref:BREX-1 system adenine-specific DNA-methyltransferase PglX n=1 Tax=Alkalihalobacillus sp. MEB130 TaxID=2976704 RepID=UPI0028DE3D58|nr:BREX-1 system adenine-specific DNA-methyltransferase PglX [Alkalihalobacillus sp. MEB130]MDT8861571.1 BREX-1 system adenine-specific DNA-methyltransferase PglX [Alkalihalobacillus sp. MEB130]